MYMDTWTSGIGDISWSVATISRPDGTRVEYTVSGSGGPAVLLIQGVGVIGEGWRPQIDALSDRFRVVAFDNRGIGRSALAAGAPVTIQAMAEDALAIMDAERIERFHVVGHSMGGLIAQQLALMVPRRVRSLSLLCTFATGKQGARLTTDTLLTALRTRIGTRRMRRNAFVELVMPRAYLAGVDRAELAERLRPLFGHDLADQPAIVMRQLRAMSRYDALGSLHLLASIPTIVVSAAEDRIALPPYGRAVAAAIPGARFSVVPDAGHGVTIHRARLINDLLAAHFQYADDRPRTPPPTLRPTPTRGIALRFRRL
jgi:pimeloyl-ACP methyl ester carboxylesterase